ncbi:Hypothetical predicted protein [Mytilus galloprovincialis]|uniref:Reverse transcriptase domain-containing protein n=1 Tax=Mytilus galloprovincialis TaxID=29158 RepID=A0A8B6ESJ6_MYTGA|nr:Hypothetical predicted protein [Mytilus galloprovincialis]
MKFHIFGSLSLKEGLVTVEEEKPQDTLDDKVRKVKFPKIHIPVGGRLTHFLQEWEQITQDQWVLSIIKDGYKLEFLQKPPFQGIKKTVVSTKNLDILNLEINSLLEKGAIEKVPVKERMTGFYSTLFLVPKKNGQMRPVINLKPLNQYLRKQHFKMDTISKVLNLVKQGDWAISLDLKDAYFHIKVFKNHRKYLRFSVQGQVYQFKALCFGPTSSPRVFTKVVVSVVAAHLRKQNIRLAVYLDDWMCVNQFQQKLVIDREIMLNLLVRLGFFNQSRKVQFNTKSNNHLFGSGVQVRSRFGITLLQLRTGYRVYFYQYKK